MLKELAYPFDSSYLIKKRKHIREILINDGTTRIKKNIAVLGGSTTSEIINQLELFLLNYGIEPLFYESEYGQYEQDSLFPNEELLSFQPDLIYIHTTYRNIKNLPSPTDSKDTVNQKLKIETEKFTAIWNSLKDRFHCPIIQNNFELPLFRLMGNKDCSDYRGISNFIGRLNNAFYEYSSKTDSFYINDLNYVAADFGLKEWQNPSYWNMYKYAMCFEAIPYLSFSVSNIIKSIFGKNKKAVALDLDNTLWGGVVGDDGVENIEIGQENGVSQSYYEFQSYIKQLKSLGVILTVCSKNDHENAIDGLNHPEGALKPDDFIIIKANWDNKDQNIINTANELSIFPDAFVFVDDNPAERAIVSAQIKDIAVPEIDSVENYIINIDRNAYFEITNFSEDDIKRNEMYKENVMRQVSQASFADYGEFLTSLDMKAVIEDFTPLYIARITQLTNKSNQFNLTTKRYTPDEMDTVWKSNDYIRLYGKLIDKFGDNGVVSVVIGKKKDKELHLDLWLMSCRVLKRDMEQAMLDELVRKCTDQGIDTIYGYYYPTKKNGMVKDLYKKFGFDLVEESSEGNTKWSLNVLTYKNQNRYIKVNEGV